MCSKNKGADQLRSVTAKLICPFAFAYENCWFSGAAAHSYFSNLEHLQCNLIFNAEDNSSISCEEIYVGVFIQKEILYFVLFVFYFSFFENMTCNSKVNLKLLMLFCSKHNQNSDY